MIIRFALVIQEKYGGWLISFPSKRPLLRRLSLSPGFNEEVLFSQYLVDVLDGTALLQLLSDCLGKFAPETRSNGEVIMVVPWCDPLQIFMDRLVQLL